MIVRFKKPIYRKIFDLALPYLKVRRNEIHTKICYRFALELLKSVKANPEIVIPAVLLHDVGWSKVPPEKLGEAFGPTMKTLVYRDMHEKEGEKIARALLARVRYPQREADAIALIVGRHDSGQKADTIEEALVKDADKLYRYSDSAFSMDPETFGMTAKDYYDHVVPRIDPWFLTRRGKRIALRETESRRIEIFNSPAPRRGMAGDQTADFVGSHP